MPFFENGCLLQRTHVKYLWEIKREISKSVRKRKVPLNKTMELKSMQLG